MEKIPMDLIEEIVWHVKTDAWPYGMVEPDEITEDLIDIFEAHGLDVEGR